MADPVPDVVTPFVHADLAERVETLWDRASELSVADTGALDVVTAAIDLLDSGEARIAEIDPTTDQVVVHQSGWCPARRRDGAPISPPGSSACPAT